MLKLFLDEFFFLSFPSFFSISLSAYAYVYRQIYFFLSFFVILSLRTFSTVPFSIERYYSLRFEFRLSLFLSIHLIRMCVCVCVLVSTKHQTYEEICCVCFYSHSLSPSRFFLFDIIMFICYCSFLCVSSWTWFHCLFLFCSWFYFFLCLFKRKKSPFVYIISLCFFLFFFVRLNCCFKTWWNGDGNSI